MQYKRSVMSGLIAGLTVLLLVAGACQTRVDGYWGAVPTPTPYDYSGGGPTGCQARGALPDPTCTPGVVLTTDATAVCKQGYSRGVRNVPDEIKRHVYAEYGIASHKSGTYEVDHLISLQLGGSNDIKNLWPEAAEPRPGYHEKDMVENYLHSLVCSGKQSIQDVQHTIATDWLAVYNSMPDSAKTPTARQTPVASPTEQP